MQARTRTIFTAVCFLVFMVPMIGCAGTAPKTTARLPVSYALPEIKKDCYICHLPAGSHKAAELKKKLSSLCLDCHRDRTAPAEHQVDIVPTMEVRGLPLTDGMITCFTCHDPHRNPHGSLLRMKATDLCLVCHPL